MFTDLHRATCVQTCFGVASAAARNKKWQQNDIRNTGLYISRSQALVRFIIPRTCDVIMRTLAEKRNHRRQNIVWGRIYTIRLLEKR